jgi:hypothetical protein
VFLCGDFNTPGITSTSIDVRLNEFLTDTGYQQHVTEPTRKGNGIDNLLDLVICRPDVIAIRDIAVTNVAFSDHRLISFSVDLPKPPVLVTTYSYRNLRSINSYEFTDLLKKSPIVTNPPVSVDDYVTQLDSDILRVLDQIAPMQSKTKRVSPRTTPAWMNPEVRDAKCTARRLERRYHTTKADCEYVNWRRVGQAAVRQMNSAWVNYYQEQIQSAGSDSKGLWNTVKKVLHSSAAKLKLNRFAGTFSRTEDQREILFLGTASMIVLTDFP